MKNLPIVRIVRVSAVLSAVSLLFAAGSVFADTPTVSVVSLSPGNTVSVGTNVTFGVSTSGFIDPYYSLDDDFVDGSLGSVDLNSAGDFSWTPEENDVGTHDVTITAHDNSGDEGSVTLTLTVDASGSTSVTSSDTTTSAPYAVSIGAPYPGSTVAVGQTLSFGAVSSGFSSTPSYTVIDSFPNSSVTSSDIGSSGAFVWTPTPSDVGTHVLTVTASNTNGQSSNATIVITVSGTSDTTTANTTTSTDTTAADTFTEQLTTGSTGSQVTALQQLLTAQGDFSGPVTGYYGSLTVAAVEKFQAAHSIDQLGIVGPDTRTALNALETSSDTTASTDTTADTSTSGTTSTNTTTITQIQSEIQSLNSELTQIESQLSALVGQ